MKRRQCPVELPPLAHLRPFGYDRSAMEPDPTTRTSYLLEPRTFLARVSGGLFASPFAAAPQVGKVVVPLLALLLLCAMPHSAHAQVFIASHPQPDFAIGPLFVSASVGKENTGRTPGPLTVTVSWSLALPPQRRATDIAQDLYLLWPAEVAGTVGAAGADPTLVRQVEPLGFRIKEHGRLRLSARSRAEMGTTAGVRQLGEAPFVTFGRESGLAAGARGAASHPLGPGVGEPRLARQARTPIERRGRHEARELAGGDVLGAALPHHAQLWRCRLRITLSPVLRRA